MIRILQKTKVLLLVAIAMIPFLNASAQTMKLSARQLPSLSGETLNGPAKEIIKPEAGQAWWGYYKGTEDYYSTGIEKTETFDCAIFIPGNLEPVAGATIHALRIWFHANTKVKDLKVWMSSRLPKTAEQATIECKSIENAEAGVKDYRFDNSYQIPAEGVYVGYTFTITSLASDYDAWPIYISKGMSTSNAFFFKSSVSYKNWIDWSQQPGEWGNLAMQVLIGDNFLSYGAGLESVNNGVALVGGEVSVPFKVKNYGSAGIKNLNYTVTTNGVTSPEYYLNIDDNPNNAFYDIKSYKLKLQGDADAKRVVKTVTITKVNGKPNEVTDGRASKNCDLTSVAKLSPRKPVMELYTTNTGGLCPLGLVAIDRLSKTHPDDFVGIEVHAGDVMALPSYTSLREQLQTSTYPWGDINRELITHPYLGDQIYTAEMPLTMFGIEDDFQNAKQKVVEAHVEVVPRWDNADSTRIKVNTHTVFQYDCPQAEYALSYVLCADSLTGTGDAWGQNNILPHFKDAHNFDFDSEVLNTFVLGESLVKGLKFNHVAVALYGDEYGIPGTIRAPLVVDDVQKHEYFIDITGNTFIQNKKNLKLVALLIDTRSGRIVNADKQAILDPYSSGIDSYVGNEAVEVARYSIDGQLLTTPRKGVNIVKYSDGRVVKVLVK